MGVTKRHPGIKAVTLPKDIGHDHPGHALSPQPTHQLLSLLLVTAQLDHGPTFKLQERSRRVVTASRTLLAGNYPSKPVQKIPIRWGYTASTDRNRAGSAINGDLGIVMQPVAHVFLHQCRTAGHIGSYTDHPAAAASRSRAKAGTMTGRRRPHTRIPEQQRPRRVGRCRECAS